MSKLNNTIWVVLGTRPEAIKQAPVYLELVKQIGVENVSLIGTGQHAELLNQALRPFRLKLDVNLEIMGRGEDLTGISALILQEMGAHIKKYGPRCLIVQGDTSTAAMSGLAAFLNKVPVIHNEAGLRSYDNFNPFPEEINRKILTNIADIHLAPTKLAYDVLIKENIAPHNVYLTGNTGIDALMMALQSVPTPATLNLLNKIKAAGRKPVFMTAHRRENAGQGMEDWISCVADFFKRHPELALVFPLHPNNLAREAADAKLGVLENCHLMDPVGYVDCCHILGDSHFVVTDSGGIQEEASTLGVPVVVCRKTTERMEAVNSEIAILAGLKIESIIRAMDWANKKANKGIRTFQNIYGDGKASQTIAEIVLSRIMVNDTTTEMAALAVETEPHIYGDLLRTTVLDKKNIYGVKNV